jgi:hypothetical protein
MGGLKHILSMDKVTNTALFNTVKELILKTQQHVASSVNAK